MVWLLLSACAPSVQAPVSDDTAAPPGMDVSALESALADDFSHSGAAGVSLAVYADGGVVYTATLGAARPDGSVPLTPQTRFSIGSTTKVITALATLQEVERGGWSLDTPLSELLPALDFADDPEAFSSITVAELLSHQGGLQDWGTFTGGPEDAELSAVAYDRFAQSARLLVAPGTFWNYANTHFSLLGLALEEQSGVPWTDHVTAEVLVPLGLGCLGRGAEVVAAGDYAVGSGINPRGEAAEIGPEDYESAWLRPAGLLWCTPTDMVNLAGFLMAGDPAVLSDTLRTAMGTPQVDTLYPGEPLGYGYGMFVQEALTDGTERWPTAVWHHGGNTLGHSSALYLLPEYGVAVSILSSGYGTDFEATALAALRTFAPALPAAEPAIVPTVDTSQLWRHAGRYIDPVYGEIIITAEEGALRVEMPTLAGYGYEVDPELLSIATDSHYASLSGQWLELTFIGEPDAPSQWIRNRSFVAARADEPVSTLAPAVAAAPVLPGPSIGPRLPLTPPW